MDEPQELPPFDPSMDEEEWAAAVDAMIEADPVARQRANEINVYFSCLKAAVDADTWKLVMEVEARTNERWSEVLLVVARHAFSEGVRSVSPPPAGV